jgi:hypothetical protein
VPGPFQYCIWFLCTLLEVSVVVCSIAKGSFRRYLSLNVYMFAACFVNLARFKILFTYGYLSPEYGYFYYYSDLLLTIGLYCALMGLYTRVFEEMGAGQYVRLGAVLLLLGTAGFSFAIVQQSSRGLIGHFVLDSRAMGHLVLEASQNLYFVGLVLTYVLWGAMLKLRETRTRLIQLVLALGLYFSVFAASYAFRNLSTGLRNDIWPYFIPISGCLLPLAWAYAFWRIPEDARLVPSRLAVVPR